VAAKVLARALGAQSIRKAEAWMHGVKKEAAILHRLSACPNIINVVGVYEKRDGAVVLMEYASGGSLRDFLHGIDTGDSGTGTGTGTGKGGSTSSSTTGTAGTGVGALPAAPLEPLRQVVLLSILIDVCQGMAFCYAQSPAVHHRDLKPHNVLRLSNGRWVLADFGISKIDSALTSTHTKGTFGTPAWSSPEQLNSDHQGEPSDVWSFGVLMWEATTRQVPWAGTPAMEVLMGMVQGQRLPMPEPPVPSSPLFKHKVHTATRRELASIMADCWHQDPSKRPSFTRILRALQALAAKHADFEETRRACYGEHLPPQRSIPPHNIAREGAAGAGARRQGAQLKPAADQEDDSNSEMQNANSWHERTVLPFIAACSMNENLNETKVLEQREEEAMSNMMENQKRDRRIFLKRALEEEKFEQADRRAGAVAGSERAKAELAKAKPKAKGGGGRGALGALLRRHTGTAPALQMHVYWAVLERTQWELSNTSSVAQTWTRTPPPSPPQQQRNLIAAYAAEDKDAREAYMRRKMD
jgi:serine/threonine protein kinase